MTGFLWDDKNTSHIAKHGVTRREAEFVVRHARRPYPSYEGDGKWLVRGRTETGEYLQVVYVLASDASIDYAQIDLVALPDEVNPIYVIHARKLKDFEKRRYRKRRKGR